MLVLFCMRGCGCIERPAFPAPSDLRRRDVFGKPRAKAAARSRRCVFFSLAPRLRGEGWGEGLSPRFGLAKVPLTRRYAPTSPRRRGEGLRAPRQGRDDEG